MTFPKESAKTTDKLSILKMVVHIMFKLVDLPFDPNVAAEPKQVISVAPSKNLLNGFQPIVIDRIWLDWDGTIQPSYYRLQAIDLLQNVIAEHSGENSPVMAEKFLKELVPNPKKDFQPRLHKGKPTLHFFQAFVENNNITIDAKTMADAMFEARKLQKMAAEIDPYLYELYKRTEPVGTQLDIYTNSGEVSIANSMRKGKVDPKTFECVFPKGGSVEFEVKPTGLWAEGAKAFAQRSIPYIHISKPSAVPLIQVAEHTGTTTDRSLFVGEGRNDFLIVWDNPKQPNGIFAYHKAGAEQITPDIQAINERLRPGAEPLGHEALINKANEKGVPPEAYLTLHEGLKTLVEMIDSGRIILAPPPRRAVAREIRQRMTAQIHRPVALTS